MRLLFACLFIAIVVIGLLVSSVMADSNCNDEPSAKVPCTPNSAFNLLLPYVSGNMVQGDAPLEGPSATPVVATTIAVTTTPTSVSPTAVNPTAEETPAPEATTPSAPTSSLPPTADSSTPMATSQPQGTSTVAPTATATQSGSTPSLLFDPPAIAEISTEGSGLRVSWTGCQAATSARVLVGQAGTRPSEITTTQQSVTTPALSGAGTYQVTIECYDSLGNSVFGSPMQTVVQ